MVLAVVSDLRKAFRASKLNVPFSPLDISEKNGCMYRHALPQGFMLKSQKKALDAAAKADVISLEEFLEVEVIVLLSFKRLPNLLTSNYSDINWGRT